MARLKNNEFQKYVSLNIPEIHNPAVVVVDVINGFVEEGILADKAIQRVIPGINALTESTDKHIFFVDYHSKYAAEFEGFPPHCIAGSDETQIHDLVNVPLKAHIIKKNSTNGFYALKADKRFEIIAGLSDSFIITGCCTDICVMQFALSMKTYFNEKNIRKPVIIPIDMVDTYDAPEHSAEEYNDMALRLMRNAGIVIVKDLG